MNQIADFFDIPDFPCPHFADKNLMERFHLFPNRPDNPEGRIIIAGRMQYAELCGKQLAQEIFYAGLSITSGYADDRQIRHLLQNPRRIIDIMAVDSLFNRMIQPVYQKNAYGNQHKQNCQNKRTCIFPHAPG